MKKLSEINSIHKPSNSLWAPREKGRISVHSIYTMVKSYCMFFLQKKINSYCSKKITSPFFFLYKKHVYSYKQHKSFVIFFFSCARCKCF